MKYHGAFVILVEHQFEGSLANRDLSNSVANKLRNTDAFFNLIQLESLEMAITASVKTSLQELSYLPSPTQPLHSSIRRIYEVRKSSPARRIRGLQTPEAAISISKNDLSGLVVLGQIARSFIACLIRRNDGTVVVLIDQHAADERIQLEHLQDIQRSGATNCRVLIELPRLSEKERHIAAVYKTKLDSLGLELLLQGRCAKLTSVPEVLKEKFVNDPAFAVSVIKEFLLMLDFHKGDLGKTAIDARLYELACSRTSLTNYIRLKLTSLQMQ